MYDLIVIGAGPAGIAASVYAARKKMDFLVVTGDIGGQVVWSADVENYLGYQFIAGADLVSKFREHLRVYNVNCKENEPVANVKADADKIFVSTKKGEYESRTLIIASGKRSKELGVNGEKEFKNRGLTYCATCDGPLFAGKDVAIIGGGNSALDAGLQMMRIARRTYIVNIAATLQGDAVMQEKLMQNSSVTVLNNTQVSAVAGDKFVKGIVVKKEGREEWLSVQGVFVEIGLIPNSEFAVDVEKNELAEIKVNCRSETSIPGIFAAGDVTDVPAKQIIVAAGEGAKAALAAFAYLSRKKV